MKVAVVGCGYISDIYMKNMCQRFSVLEVVGCCDLNCKAAQNTAERYQIAVLTMDEILADANIEIVVVLTGASKHYEVIKPLLMAGKHVYTEKVLTLNLGEAKELIDLADEKGVYLGVAPDTFLGSAIQNARQLVTNGMIGDVTSAQIIVNRDFRSMEEMIPYLSQKDGSLVTDVGVYYVTALLCILGNALQVSAMKTQRLRERTYCFTKSSAFGKTHAVEHESVLTGSILFENDVLCSVHFNSESILPEQHQLAIWGTEGILYLPTPDHFEGEVKLIRKGQTEPVVIPSVYGYDEDSRGLGVADMAWAIQQSREPRANKQMAYHALEILLGLLESGETGGVITIQSDFVVPKPLPAGYMGKTYLFTDEEAALIEN